MERRLSGGVSIGTGMVLESIFTVPNRYDPDRVIPNKVDIDKYDYHVYNLHTIVRNVVNSLPSGNLGYKEKDLKNMVIDDINKLNEYYKDIETTPMIMVTKYAQLEKRYNKAKNNDTVSKALLDLYELGHYVDSLKIEENKSIEMGVFKAGTPTGDAKILLTTSFLLDVVVLGNVDLLESHTGVFKNKYKYNTKLKGVGKVDISHIPYNKITHILLGDKTYVKPVLLVERRELLKIAEKWTPRTTYERVLSDVIKNKELKKYIS